MTEMDARGGPAEPKASPYTRPQGVSSRSMVLLGVATGLGLLHHVDHVLRVDHSGWPFLAEVTPFTYSLAIYPLLLVAFLARSRPLISALLVALVLVAVLAAHVFTETPADQFGVWAYNASSEPYALGQPNLLGIESPVLGLLAAGLAISVSIGALATVLSLVADALTMRRVGTEGS